MSARGFFRSLLFVVSLTLLTPARAQNQNQNFDFKTPASVSDAATPNAMRDLAERILPVYQDADIERYLATLSVLQMAAGKNMGQAMKDVMADPEMRKAGKEVSKYVGKVISDRLLPNGVDEKAVLAEAKDFVGEEVGMHVSLNPAEDPENKRRHAIPGRPALLIK